ncbi:MAG: rhodanese-like domain-containing protein [Chloroflexi bacterium]|nr:rhodanese-like domain-containing protein [Chloroflexota bacterium]
MTRTTPQSPSLSHSSEDTTGTTGPSLPPAVYAADLDALRRQGADVRVIDVRTPAEFETAHIPGSYNVPLDQLSEHCAELVGIGAPVVLVCRSGNRARQAEATLKDAHMPRVHVLDGGVMAWQQAGLSLIHGRQTWSLERQVRAIAGGLVLLGTLGSLFVWPPLIYLAVFVGAGLLFAGLTDTCAMGMLLARMPWNRGAACDVSGAVACLAANPDPRDEGR